MRNSASAESAAVVHGVLSWRRGGGAGGGHTIQDSYKPRLHCEFSFHSKPLVR